ncbi:MAG TPA: serine/threonine protein kinase, partial [Nannocystaceae bacterium]|nr:serine/threonine protein kinase [Nannocystaceae bacterium]
MDETELGRTRGSEAAMTLRSEPSKLARGDSLGRYVVLGPVGAGGMGVVYAAYDPELDRKVAIKLLHPTIAGDADSQGSQRLVREAQSLAKLQHPE